MSVYEMRPLLVWALLCLSLVGLMLLLQGCDVPCGRPPFPCS